MQAAWKGKDQHGQVVGRMCGQVVLHMRPEGGHQLSKVHAGLVGHEDPADKCADQRDRPHDPELAARAQVVEPHRRADGAQLHTCADTASLKT